MKKSILMMLTAVLIASCSKTETGEPAVTGDVPFLLKSTNGSYTVSAESTRAPYTGAVSETNPLEARILTTTAENDYSANNIYANGKMIFKGGSTPSGYDLTTVTGAQAVFPSAAASTKYYMAGLYPYAGGSGWGNYGATAEFTFTGKEDVMAAKQVETTRDGVVAGNIPQLTFNHLLTKLEVTLKAENNVAVGVWQKVSDIQLTEIAGAKLKNKVTVTLETGAAAFDGSATDFSLYQIDNGTYADDAFKGHSLTESAVTTAYVLVAPFDASSPNDLTFKLFTNRRTETVKVQLPAGPTVGRAYGITFTFKADAGTIVSEVDVIEWLSAGSVEKVIQ